RSAMPKSKDDDKEYGFGDTQKTLVLIKSDGEKALTLQLGQRRTGGGVYVRLDEKPDVYLVGQMLSFAADAKEWENKTLAQLPLDDVTRGSAYNPGGKRLVAFARKEKGQDFVLTDDEYESINQKEATNLARLAENMDFEARIPAKEEETA